MVPELIAGVSAFKTMLDITKGLKDITDASLRNGAVIELQEKILSAQMVQMALIQRVDDLEKQLAGMETWNTEKQRYELAKLPPGVLVYALKSEAANGEPSHQICATCFEQNRKSFLHNSEIRNGVTTLTCNGCGNSIKSGYFQAPQPQSTRDHDPYGR